MIRDVVFGLVAYNDLPKGGVKYGVYRDIVFGLVSIDLCHNNSEVGGLRPSPARIAEGRVCA